MIESEQWKGVKLNDLIEMKESIKGIKKIELK